MGSGGTAQLIKYDRLFTHADTGEPMLHWLNGRDHKALLYVAALRRVHNHKLRGAKSLELLDRAGLKTADIAELACRMNRLLQSDRLEFCKQYDAVLHMYNYQMAFDPRMKQVVSLTRDTKGGARVGEIQDTAVALSVVTGRVHPVSLEQFAKYPNRCDTTLLEPRTASKARSDSTFIGSPLINSPLGELPVYKTVILQ